MFYIGFLQHVYQPPTQKEEITRQIFEESYEPLLKTLEEKKNIFLSLDIAKSLAEKLPKNFLQRIQILHSMGIIELVNTAAYHYLLPLIPQEVITRQLNLNLEFYRQNFADENSIKGVFPPELAVNPVVIRQIKGLDYSWTLADDEPFVAQRLDLPEEEKAPQDWVPTMYGCGVLLRSRLWSERIAHGQYQNGRLLAKNLIESQKDWCKRRKNNQDSYLILALDAETFGHWHKRAFEIFLVPFFNEVERSSGDAKIVSLDFIFNHFPKRPNTIPSGSWSTTDPSIPFPLWDNPNNYFHQLWNEFIKIAFFVAPESPAEELQDLLDKAFYSCTPWQNAHGNKDVTKWCFPLFEKLTRLLPQKKEKERLWLILREMNRLTKSD